MTALEEAMSKIPGVVVISAYTADELLAAQRRHDASQRQITRLNSEIGRRIAERSEHEKVVAETTLILQGIKPCRTCNRLVASPCHDSAGFNENGPWDGFCRDNFR
jgi:hypothetical protein